MHFRRYQKHLLRMTNCCQLNKELNLESHVRHKRLEKKTRRRKNRFPTQQEEKAQNELTNIYLKEQTEYIQNQINKIRNSAEDRQSKIVWQTINEVSRSKSTVKAKLKASSQ